MTLLTTVHGDQKPFKRGVIRKSIVLGKIRLLTKYKLKNETDIQHNYMPFFSY